MVRPKFNPAAEEDAFLTAWPGPGSWFSVCSKPGVTWVSQRTGVNDFAKSARELTSTWTQRLKMDRSKVRPSVYHTEPDPETAWKYTAGKVSCMASRLEG